ncbi:MAG: MFS transporter [Candidatus Puniceispirillales bacterium]|tara:strand:- start:202 stop:1479 length:1278 start_codon:yes stop_codon:yes gene_type:complete
MFSINKQIYNKIGQKFFYGWTIAGIGSLGIFTSGAGQSHTFSPFIPVISKDLQISSTSITTAYMIATLFAAFLLPKVGKLVDKFGPRIVLIYTVILLGIGCLIFGAASNFLMLAVAFGFLRFFGQGTLMLGSANITTQWFDKKRGFALGLMGLGFALSMGIHPPISDFLITNYGWRYAWVIIGLSTWVLMLPPLIFLAIDKPEDVNEKPDGIKIETINEKTKIFGLSLNEALKEKSFYILSFSFFSISTLVTALHFFQVTILNQYFNLPSQEAAALFIPTMITMIIFIPLAGKFLDQYETHNVIGISLLVTTASLISISFASNITFAIIYSIIFGINNAFNLALFGYIWPRYFGRLHVGSIQGTGQMVLVVGASIGAMPFALAMDFGYDLLFTIRASALYPLLSAFLCFFFLRESQKLTDMRNQK